MSPFSYTAPSNLVLFVILTSLVFGSGFVSSRQLGTVRRMLATPTPARAIVLGQALSAVVVGLVQATGLFANNMRYDEAAVDALVASTGATRSHARCSSCCWRSSAPRSS